RPVETLLALERGLDPGERLHVEARRIDVAGPGRADCAREVNDRLGVGIFRPGERRRLWGHRGRLAPGAALERVTGWHGSQGVGGGEPRAVEARHPAERVDQFSRIGVWPAR